MPWPDPAAKVPSWCKIIDMLPSQVKVVEVGPRDGLQNETQVLSVDDKVGLIDRLSEAGLSYIEIGSFVRPEWIPQMADTEAVAARIHRYPGVTYSALVPNSRGLQRALQAELPEIAIFMSVTESHNQKNTNRSAAEALESYREVTREALEQGVKVRAYLSTVFACPYEGEVKPVQVLPLVESLLELGAYQISLGDTIGVTNPMAVQRLLAHLLTRVKPDSLALHFHDTRGTALANIYAGLQMGISVFDSAIGGLGGCPYAPGASGNIATEDLVYMLEEMGIKTGVQLSDLAETNAYLQEIFGKALSSKYSKAHLANKGHGR